MQAANGILLHLSCKFGRGKCLLTGTDRLCPFININTVGRQYPGIARLSCLYLRRTLACVNWAIDQSSRVNSAMSSPRDNIAFLSCSSIALHFLYFCSAIS